MINDEEKAMVFDAIQGVLRRLQIPVEDGVHLLFTLALNYVIQNYHGSKEQFFQSLGELYDNINEQYQDSIRSKSEGALASESQPSLEAEAPDKE